MQRGHSAGPAFFSHTPARFNPTGRFGDTANRDFARGIERVSERADLETEESGLIRETPRGLEAVEEIRELQTEEAVEALTSETQVARERRIAVEREMSSMGAATQEILEAGEKDESRARERAGLPFVGSNRREDAVSWQAPDPGAVLASALGSRAVPMGMNRMASAKSVDSPKKGLSATQEGFLKVGLWTALFAGLDLATKTLFYEVEALPYFVHPVPAGVAPVLLAAVFFFSAVVGFVTWGLSTDRSPKTTFRRWAKRHPFLGFILGPLGRMLPFNPKTGEEAFTGEAARRYAISAANRRKLLMGLGMIFGGVLGNVFQIVTLAKVVNWIPFGPINLNLADIFVAFGLISVFARTGFSSEMKTAKKTGLPTRFPVWSLFVLPVALNTLFHLLVTPYFPTVPKSLGFVFFLASFLFLLAMLNAISIQRDFKRFDLEGSVASFEWGWRTKARRFLTRTAAFLPGIRRNHSPVSERDIERFLKHLEENPPKLVILDHDNTVEHKGEGKLNNPLSEARGRILAKLQELGVQIAYATNRPYVIERDGRSFGFWYNTLENLSPEQRAGMIVAADGGFHVFQVGEDGEKPTDPAFKQTGFTAEEVEAMKGIFGGVFTQRNIFDVVMAAEATDESQIVMDARENTFVALIKNPPPGWDKSRLGRSLEKSVRRAVEDAGIEAEVTFKDTRPDPYFRVRINNKSMAVESILKMLRDQGHAIKASEVLILGDDMGPGGTDAPMPQALPGSLAIGVGKRADASIRNLFLWRTRPKPDGDRTIATQTILEAILRGRERSQEENQETKS